MFTEVIKEGLMQAKGETSTLQTGKDTNIMRKIFQ